MKKYDTYSKDISFDKDYYKDNYTEKQILDNKTQLNLLFGDD